MAIVQLAYMALNLRCVDCFSWAIWRHSAKLPVWGFILIASANSALGQGSLGEQRLSYQIKGGTIGNSPERKTTAPLATVILPSPHLDPSGKPCLTVSASARKQLNNASIYDQLLLLDNHCGSEIRLRACYESTNDCVDMSIGAYKRLEKILGIFPSQDFRYTYREYVK
jgi:hypothetical protein